MDITDSIQHTRTRFPATVSSRSRLALTVALPTAAVLTAETLLYFRYIQSALLVHLLVLVGCSLAPLVTTREATVFHAFLLVPLFRLLNFGMPILVESTLAWLTLIYGGLLGATYVVASEQPEVELPGGQEVYELLTEAPLAIVFGGVLASIEFFILRPDALVTSWASFDFFILVVVMVGFVGFGEEFLFRGVLQETLTERVGPVPAIALSGLIFGVMHGSHGILAEVGFGVAAGMLFGYLYYRSENLLVVALVHGALNVFLFGPFAF
ncbi:CPBP family intramembrane metalloprotease [Halostella sp. JP-L12]|uniref:CPBP family intramembrane glutamic endopeptidase n=1 Tax=Halostella TaxID=1843185 RepID=UPI000EF81B33|nr:MULTISPECIES: type II CAAX endopeptidase family protein [Halostella]NHN46531.1 CPBP family intramembrane metalloprotease [Halostella sp. JP-L12]